jgi:hypothetical protein
MDLFERFSFGLQIGSRVVIGRVQSLVPEPVADYRHVDTGGDELNADAVTPSVRGDALCCERWYVLGHRLNVLLELEANSCRAKRLTVAVNEDGFVIRTRLSLQQRLEHVHSKVTLRREVLVGSSQCRVLLPVGSRFVGHPNSFAAFEIRICGVCERGGLVRARAISCRGERELFTHPRGLIFFC